MSEKTVFKAVYLPSYSLDILQAYDQNDIEYTNSDYAGFDLNEIIQLAKTDPDAKEEYLNRIHKQMEGLAHSFHLKKKFIDESLIYSRLAETALQAVEIFDPEKGDADHLLNRMFKIASTYLAKDKACEYTRNMKYFGARVSEPETYSSAKTAQDAEEERQAMYYKLEIEDYASLLDETEKSILAMYSHHLTFEEIGNRLDIPTSTVSNCVYRMVSELRMRFLKTA